MYSSAHQSKLHGQPQHNQHQPNHHSFQQSQQTSEHQPQLQRGTSGQGFSVPRTISTPAWISSANPALHLHSTSSSSSNIGSTAAPPAPPAPSSASSSGSLLSYWDHSAASDSELTIVSALRAPDVQQHPMSEMGHHRYASTGASLHAISPSDIVGHPSSAHMSSSASAPSYLPAGSEHYHPYRPSSLSVGSSMSTQHAYHSGHQPGPSSGLSYSSSISTPLTSPPGFVYGLTGSSAAPPLGPGVGYDAYPPSFSSAPSQYVSYLPPALSHDSRFYPLNPFEIKHRRRTTKTQFRVLESTFREIPKPNATLRKQISAQLDMPVRAVQIWFQNRRAKAKAMEKKRQTSEGNTSTDTSQDRQRPTQGGVANHHLYSDVGERRGQQPPELSMYDDPNRGSHLSGGGHYDDGGKSLSSTMSRSMDLPPLRMQPDQQDSYGLAWTSVTLPSINTEAGPSRDTRRGMASSPIPVVPGILGNSTLGFGITSMHGEGQDHSDQHNSMRGGGAVGQGPSGSGLSLTHLQSASVDTSQSNNSTLSAVMPSASDRLNRLSPYPTREAAPPPLPSTASPRQFGHDPSRLWSAPQQ